MPIYQIIIPAFALLFFFVGWSQYSRKKKTGRELVAQTLFWLSLSYVAIFPEVVRYLALVTGIRGELNALFAFSILALGYIVMKLVVKIDVLQNEIVRLTRAIALKESKEK
ncbi:MAG: DUF2304 domain-containing protein [Patescibacteria group bacterium]|nr:DUF2304 domain-containing protein [Patescibacteria group bacterium]